MWSVSYYELQVLLAVPTVIVHRIDAWSPLAPPLDAANRMTLAINTSDHCSLCVCVSLLVRRSFHWIHVPRRTTGLTLKFCPSLTSTHPLIHSTTRSL